MTIRTMTKTGSGAGQSKRMPLCSPENTPTFLFFNPNGQVPSSIVVIQKVEGTIVRRIDKLAAVPITFAFGQVQFLNFC